MEPASMELTQLAAGISEMTIIGYCYGRNSTPYVSRFPGKNITLKQFKSVTKRGNFRYFFKRDCDEVEAGVIFEEVSDDNEVVPLWDGKVFCVIEPMEDRMDEPMIQDKKRSWKNLCRCWKA